MTEPPLILLAHGAGAGSAHPWMQAWQERLAAVGRVVTFDYPYMQKGSRRPDRLPVLIDSHRDALASARGAPGERVVLAGKSMGSRVGCHLALEERVDAIVCFGYPLRGQGKNPKIRDEVLLALETPVLFIQGTRDRLCPLDLLAAVRERMRAPSTLEVVEGGDHSLQVTRTQLKSSGETQADVDARILLAIRDFLAGGA